MKENKSVTEITGLVIIYIVNSIIIVSIIPILIPLSGFTPIIFVISSFSLVLTILYSLNVIKNRLLVGILGIPAGIIGGILVLISIKTDPKILSPSYIQPKIDSKEASVKLINLKKLLDEGIISQETFNEKSKPYIDLL